MIGGQDEPEAWYQTNEIVRRFAVNVGGHPSFLYAPALPGPELHATLMNDPAINRVLDLWRTARCAIVGVGPPPLARDSIPGFVPTGSLALRDAVGDVCSRFYDRDGRAVSFPGSDRLISTHLDDLRKIPVTIAVAVGDAKVVSIATGARAGYFTQLVTDTATATALIDHMTDERGA
jgi:DNA-binding transcriptional regulator LsrR (DeoR family)